jgi:hypothetical protein
MYVIGNAGYVSDTSACSNTYSFPTLVYAATNNPAAVTRLFLDSSLTTPFNGNYAYWKLVPQAGSQYYAVFIQNGGYVNSVDNCGYNP